MTPKPLPFKYYYNGEHVRSSYHDYTHGVINGAGDLIACRNGAENAEKARQAEKLTYKREVKYYEAKLKALRAGRSTFQCKSGRSLTWHTIAPGTTEAAILAKMKRLQESIDYIEEHYKVVELVRV
jgi:hypothetical protein